MGKSGFSDENAPKSVFSTIVGRTNGNILPSALVPNSNGVFIGDSAQQNRDIYDLHYPIENGRIVRWDDMEAVWDHIYSQELKVKSEERKCMLTEAILNPDENKEKMAEIMFEKFNVPSLHIASQAVLPIYASGKTTGLVFHSGDGVTSIAPVYEGNIILSGVCRMDMAGGELTNYMHKILQTMGEETYASVGFKRFNVEEKETVRLIKEKTAYVAIDFEKEKAEFELEADPSKKQCNYTLPDGRVIVVGAERFYTPESLFNPRMLNKELPGIHEAIHRSMCNVHPKYRICMIKNIIVSGGNTMLPGFVERLNKELKLLTEPESRGEIDVEAQPDRKNSVWRGAAVIASSETFDQWVSKKDYEENGVSAFKRYQYFPRDSESEEKAQREKDSLLGKVLGCFSTK